MRSVNLIIVLIQPIIYSVNFSILILVLQLHKRVSVFQEQTPKYLGVKEHWVCSLIANDSNRKTVCICICIIDREGRKEGRKIKEGAGAIWSNVNICRIQVKNTGKFYQFCNCSVSLKLCKNKSSILRKSLEDFEMTHKGI